MVNSEGDNKKEKSHLSKRNVFLAVASVFSILILLFIRIGGLVNITLLPFFPIISILVGIALVFLTIGIIAVFRNWLSKYLDFATRIPSNRHSKYFIIASIIVCFTFFSFFLLLAPKDIISNLSFLQNIGMTDYFNQTLTDIITPENRSFVVYQFIIFPSISAVTLCIIKWYRLITYSWNLISLESRNDVATGVVGAIKFLFYSCVLLLSISLFVGIAPSEYSLQDYFIGLAIVLPMSGILGWVIYYIINWLEEGLQQGSRKLQSLIFAAKIAEYEDRRCWPDFKFKLILNHPEQELLSKFGVPTDPMIVQSFGILPKEFKIKLIDLMEIKEYVMEYQKDRMPHSLTHNPENARFETGS